MQDKVKVIKTIFEGILPKFMQYKMCLHLLYNIFAWREGEIFLWIIIGLIF